MRTKQLIWTLTLWASTGTGCLLVTACSSGTVEEHDDSKMKDTFKVNEGEAVHQAQENQEIPAVVCPADNPNAPDCLPRPLLEPNGRDAPPPDPGAPPAVMEEVLPGLSRITPPAAFGDLAFGEQWRPNLYWAKRADGTGVVLNPDQVLCESGGGATARRMELSVTTTVQETVTASSSSGSVTCVVSGAASPMFRGGPSVVTATASLADTGGSYGTYTNTSTSGGMYPSMAYGSGYGSGSGAEYLFFNSDVRTSACSSAATGDGALVSNPSSTFYSDLEQTNRATNGLWLGSIWVSSQSSDSYCFDDRVRGSHSWPITEVRLKTPATGIPVGPQATGTCQNACNGYAKNGSGVCSEMAYLTHFYAPKDFCQYCGANVEACNL